MPEDLLDLLSYYSGFLIISSELSEISVRTGLGKDIESHSRKLKLPNITYFILLNK